MRFFVCCLLLLPCPFGIAAQTSDSFSVFFPMDDALLADMHKAQMDSLFYADWLNTASKISIIGYADYVGGPGVHNDALSESRANNVANYLIESGIPFQNIMLIQGNGAVPRPGTAGAQGVATDRRVTIVRRLASSGQGLPSASAALLRSSTTSNLPALQPYKELKENDVVRLHNIYFYPSRHVVRPESYPALEALLQHLKANPQMRVRIEGHVCCVPNNEDAMDFDTNEPLLSRNRAFFIYRWLVTQGIAPERLAYKGFGRSRPVVPVEHSEVDANKNRRVEIRILSK